MSVTELLEQIKILPPKEQEELVKLFHQWEEAGNGSPTLARHTQLAAMSEAWWRQGDSNP